MMSETVVVVTGANQGLGLEVVKKLGAENEGYRLILSSRNHEKGKVAASGITKLARNTTVEALQLDVTSDESIERAAKDIEVKYGRVDVLLNNAGILTGDGQTQREKMHQVYDTNVAGVVAVTDAFIPLLMKAKAPRLLIMSSDLGSITNTLNPDYKYNWIYNFEYKASKAAVNMVGAMYSMKYKDKIVVNIVNPGLRATNFNNWWSEAGKAEDGAIEAYRLIVSDSKETGTYTEMEGPLGW